MNHKSRYKRARYDRIASFSMYRYMHRIAGGVSRCIPNRLTDGDPLYRDVEINSMNRKSRYKRARCDRIVSFSMYRYMHRIAGGVSRCISNRLTDGDPHP